MSAAFGAWLALGAVAVAPGTGTTSRVGFLPPWWVFGALATIFLALTLGTRMSTARTRPLFAAWLCALPWIPGPVPAALLAWQGVGAALVWAGIAVAACAAEPWPAWRRAHAMLSHPRRAPFVAAVAAAVWFAALWQGPARWLPGGDEPHYLVITQSLLRDGDLKIENNHRAGDYAAYFPGELKPDYLRRGADGQIYSIHAPGISAVVLPAFALGGYRGAAWFLLIACALGASLAWRLGWHVTGEAGAAWFGWATLVSAAPVAAHAYTIFPDGLSGVLVLVGILSFLRARDAAAWPAFVGGVALAALPWMHTRNVVIAVALGLAIVLRMRVAPRRMAAFLGVPLISAAAWFASFKAIYGTFDPSAPYGGYTQSSLANTVRGVTGLLFDQQFGALATAPALLAAIVGILVLLSGRRLAARGGASPSPRALGAALALTAVSYTLLAASYYMWWGGTSAPARFLVPVLWLAAIGAAVAWAACRSAASRAAWLALLLVSGVITVSLSFGGDGLLMFTARAPFGPFVEWAARAVDLSNALPGLHRDSPPVALGTAAVWLLAGLAWWAALRRAATRTRVAVAAVPLAVAAVSIALTLVWTARDVAPLRVAASRQAALATAWDGGHGISFTRGDVDGRRVRSGLRPTNDLLPLIEISTIARGAAAPPQLAAFSALPAGEYRVRVAFTEPRTGRVRIEVGRGGVIRDEDLASLPLGRDGRARLDFALPAAVDNLTVHAVDGASANAATLSAMRLAPKADQPLADRAHAARRYGDVETFFTTDAQYPEPGGVWFKAGGEIPAIVQAPAATTGVTLLVRNGPLDNHVELRDQEWRQSLDLAAHQEVEIPWPWTPPVDRASRGAASVADRIARVLHVRAATAFRPIDFDPSGQDPRRLGVWIEFR